MLRVVVGEILRPILHYQLVQLDKKSKTAHLYLKALIWPVILRMRFVRANREANLPLHTHILKLILPYIVLAGQWHYLCYASV